MWWTDALREEVSDDQREEVNWQPQLEVMWREGAKMCNPVGSKSTCAFIHGDAGNGNGLRPLVECSMMIRM